MQKYEERADERYPPCEKRICQTAAKENAESFLWHYGGGSVGGSLSAILDARVLMDPMRLARFGGWEWPLCDAYWFLYVEFTLAFGQRNIQHCRLGLLDIAIESNRP